MNATILVVDDDEALAEMVGIVLAQEGFETAICETGDQAADAFRTHQPDLILLDFMLPGMNGIEVCTQIRQESDVPIIMLTAKSDTEDVVRGLEAGADDYIAKPFKPAELLARVRARLRPKEEHSKGHLLVGGLEIDLAGHTVSRGGENISLTPLEFDLLANLAQQPGQVMTRESLLDNVWGYEKSVDSRLVNVHIQRLRSKIEQDPENPQIVLTVRGVGYKAVSDKPHR
ncbi:MULTISPECIES: MtrAB system response regulator MtrA [Rothia]|uniref:DNA-binding response regulator MtrA n=1 Tax=Rothia amarae TaxID=169480 RepID=A0A7H2BLP8_9MICC|nr:MULTISPECIES: MtrAB system response regulator MtrA [Rothia]QNV40594.1 response regulator transcription factor [Rothia amarae]SIJ72783.1 DNA-binding response regulator MtrA [Mycobacteroides abscessus subsp. abscessus]